MRDVSAFWRRQDQASARNLVAYQLAAAPIIVATYDHAETLRVRLGGRHPWQAEELTRIRFLANWIVQTCLVSAGKVLVVAKRGHEPDEWLPGPVAAWLEQVYRLGNSWVPLLEQAFASDEFTLTQTLPVPLGLRQLSPSQLSPRNPPSPDLSNAEIQALAELVDAVANQVDLLWDEIDCGYQTPRELRPWAEKIRQRRTGLHAEIQQRQALWLGQPEGALRAEHHDRLWALVADLFRQGQGIIMPSLFDRSFTLRADRVVTGGAAETPQRRMLTSLRTWLGFDPLVLTAEERRANPTLEDLQRLDALWRDDPQPLATLRVVESLTQAVADGAVERLAGEALRECPWAPVYVVRRTIVLGERLGKGVVFAFNPKVINGAFTHYFQRIRVEEPVRDINLWFFSSPEAHRRWGNDPQAIGSLNALWAADDNPAVTRRLLFDVLEAERTGAIRRRPARMMWGTCPWPATFAALRRCGIGGENIRAGEVFALTVDRAGGRFSRRIIRIGRINS